jgi:phosphoribosylformylglycinamidine synthase
MGQTPQQENKGYRFTVQQDEGRDPRSTAYLKDAHALGLTAIRQITCFDLYFLQGNLSPAQLHQLANQILHDPVTQTIQWKAISALSYSPEGSQPGSRLVEVALRPGVSDPVAEQILRAAHILEIHNINAASTGQRFVIKGEELTPEDLHRLAVRLLCNPVIQHYTLGEIMPSFPTPAEPNTPKGVRKPHSQVETIPIRDLNDAMLQQLSLQRRAALDLAEMQAIRAYFQAEGREVSDVEFEMIAQTWSEHCCHKTFKAHITLEGQVPGFIDNLFKHTIQAATSQIQAPWVHSVFSDNAGIIDFDGANDISFKVETHNHPSAIEPFGGANTGTGGVIRDVIGVSARPIAATDVLCFGPSKANFADLPEGVLHPRRIASGVVAGIQDYGNKIGIPTVSGAVLYDPGYISNPLVFCGCVGIAPIGAHPRQAQASDRIIVIGGRTGRDGLRGATFSSMTMDAQTGEVAGASVQIGEPIIEKGLIDVTLIARDRRLYHAITDCGGGGLSSAVGEMVSEMGGLVQMERIPLKYAGLAPWEIWLSEAQERMVLAVPPQALAELRELCDLYEVEMTDIGEFTATHRLVINYGEKKVLDLDNGFLHNGRPQRRLTAVQPVSPMPAGRHAELDIPIDFPYAQILLDLLAHPNIASKENIIRIYDHEVQGGTVVKPLTGINNDGPSDACVIHPLDAQGRQAIAISAGINPEYGKLDPYQMAINVLDEALRNATAVGADPNRTAVLDNFCWGDPLKPHILGELVAAANGCRDGAVAFQTPFISGKDSLNNEYLGVDGKRHAIPPTLLISGIGVLEDWNCAVSMDLKESGNRLYLVGIFAPTLGGSHFNLVRCLTASHPEGCSETSDGIPSCRPAETRQHYLALHTTMQEHLVQACHDLSEGGLSVTAAEMCIGGRLGMALRLPNPDEGLALPGSDPLRACFGETTGCLLVEVREADAPAFEAHFNGLSCCQIGLICPEQQLTIRFGKQTLIDLPVDRLFHAWHPELD